ncbi:MAG: hypothetical protein GXP55_07470 [Deltaproteobacteria bacterium]|nr:hypothetical protein [Deltaproteobacteria bacterium]
MDHASTSRPLFLLGFALCASSFLFACDGGAGATCVEHDDCAGSLLCCKPSPSPTARGTCQDVPMCGVVTPVDAGTPDTGAADTGAADTGTTDTGTTDSGPGDSGTTDSGPGDSGTTDSGPGDSGTTDSGITDSGPGDSGSADAA